MSPTLASSIQSQINATETIERTTGTKKTTRKKPFALSQGLVSSMAAAKPRTVCRTVHTAM